MEILKKFIEILDLRKVKEIQNWVAQWLVPLSVLWTAEGCVFDSGLDLNYLWTTCLWQFCFLRTSRGSLFFKKGTPPSTHGPYLSIVWPFRKGSFTSIICYVPFLWNAKIERFMLCISYILKLHFFCAVKIVSAEDIYFPYYFKVMLGCI